jgi:hypothetical protein
MVLALTCVLHGESSPLEAVKTKSEGIAKKG